MIKNGGPEIEKSLILEDYSYSGFKPSYVKKYNLKYGGCVGLSKAGSLPCKHVIHACI